MMFSGFTSRCSTRWPCAWPSPCATSRITRSAVFAERRASRYSARFDVARLVAIVKCPSTQTALPTATLFGWRSRVAMRASCSIAARPHSFTAAGCAILSATFTPSMRSRAFRTSANDPCPRRRSSRYLPSLLPLRRTVANRSVLFNLEAERAQFCAHPTVLGEQAHERLHRRARKTRRGHREVVVLVAQRAETQPGLTRDRLDRHAPVGALLGDRRGHREVRARLVGVAGRAAAAEQLVDQHAPAAAAVGGPHPPRGVRAPCG